ncbi:MAG: molybdopterin cofactor-binding domain-containing protein [Acidimicrobiales bacterium]
MFADIEPLAAVVDPESAFDEGQPIIFPEHGSNIAVSSTDPQIDDMFSDADHVGEGLHVNQRVAPVPMEPNSAAAVWGDDGRLTFCTQPQMPHLLHLLAGALTIDPGEIRVIAPHVGGGFGAKAGTCPDSPCWRVPQSWWEGL